MDTPRLGMIRSFAGSRSVRAIVYAFAVGLILAWATWRRFSLPLDPIADPDTGGYLSSALHKLMGGAFVHVGARNFLYPGFLFVLLRLFGDFRAIVVVQHLLGLAAGALFFLTWTRLWIFARPSSLKPSVHHVLGLVGMAVVVSAAEPIHAEMQIRPEGVCAFFLGLNLCLVVEFWGRTFVQPNKHVIGVGIGTVASAIVLALLKPSFVLLALLSLVPLGIFFLGRNLARKKIALVLGGALAAAILLLPEYFLSREDRFAQAFLPTTLFVLHADLIRDQMADDARRGSAGPYSRDWLIRMHDQLAAEIEKSAAAEGYRYPSLGFNPDYLMYKETSIAAQISREFDHDVRRIDSFYFFYYWRTWRQRPLAMWEKIRRQMALFYQPICPAFYREGEYPLTSSYQESKASLAWLSDSEFSYPPAADFVRRSAALADHAPAIQQSKSIRHWANFLAGAYLPLLGLTTGLAAIIWFGRRERARIGALVLLTLFVFSYNLAACFEGAVINTLQVPRYATVQFYFTVLAEFLAIWLVLEFIVQWATCGRPIQTATPGE